MTNIILLVSLFLFLGCDSAAPVKDAPHTYTTGLVKPEHRHDGVFHFNPRARAPISDNFDWVAQGFETPVRNQGGCGSCWAFAGTQTIEMGYKIFAHKDIDFSEQQLVGALYDGCGGGYTTYDYQVKNGQTDEKSCPYTQSNHRCSQSSPVAGKGVTGGMVGHTDQSPSVAEVQTAIMTYGALSVTVGANGSFMNIDSDDAGCGGTIGTNHMVALVGWKTVNGKVLFHVKNSWGTHWGNQGYSYIGLGCWNLGEDVSYLAVNAVPCQPPKVKLPAEYTVAVGDTVMLAVKDIPSVTYEWSENGKVLGTSAQLEYMATASAVIMLKVHNECGDGEIKTQILVK